MRQPKLHGNKADAPPPERYVQHEVQRGETMTEISHRYQTSMPMLEAANPQIANPSEIEIGQKVNVPIGAGYGTEPTRDVAEPGQTLTDMAREHPGVSARDIARANRADLPRGSRVQPGQELWIPAQKPATPLEQKVQATDQAQAALDRAQQAYDELPPDTHPATRQEVYQGVQEAKGKLTGAVREELDVRAKQVVAPEGTWANDEDRYAAAGAQLKERYQADAGATQQLDAALDGLAHERHQTRLQGQANAIVDKARNAGDAQQQMASLNESLQAATPEVREAVTRSQGYRDLLQGAADWATEPLAGGDAREAESNHGMPQAASTIAAERLEQLTQGLPPELAADLTDKAMPTIEAFNSSFKTHYPTLHSPFQGPGFQSLMTVLDRGMGTPQGQANLQKLAGHDVWDLVAMHEHVAQGGRPAYALAWADAHGVDRSAVERDMHDAIQTHMGRVDGVAKEYAAHTSELAWLIANHGNAMTPEQLEKAIEDYTQAKGEDWKNEADRLKAELVKSGSALAKQFSDLNPDADGAELAKQMLDNPTTQMAFEAALQENPELLEGPQGKKLADFFSSPAVQAKLANQGRKLLNVMATAQLKHTVLDKIGDLDPNDPTSVANAKQALANLKDSSFAKLLGLSSKEMDEVVEALENTIPKAGESADEIAARVSLLDEKLGGMKGLDGSTVAGQLFRVAGLGLSGVGFVASVGKTINDPSIQNGLQTIISAAGLGNQGSELLVALGKVDENSTLGKLGSKAAGKLLGVLGASMEVWNMGRSFANGDIPSGILYGTGAAGGLLATFGAGSLAGPIGIGLVL
ncbi:MAG: LysM peptidoglycan-binding domain-containing protein, partial [Comamonadaceae bacterium]|nr:LysM peptidoglycan-binding domain-containing protein [Comamonadaceae bacterium]